jgi:hypothetical protein
VPKQESSRAPLEISVQTTPATTPETDPIAATSPTAAPTTGNVKKGAKKPARKPKAKAKKPSVDKTKAAKRPVGRPPKAAPAESAKGVSKTDFVLSLPLELPAAEVSAKAKAAGHTITTQHVHVIRSLAKRRSGSKGAKNKSGAPKPTAAKKVATAANTLATPKAKSATKLSRSAFILSLPRELSAAEVVAQGRAAGLKFVTGYVHNVRSQAKHKKGKPGRPRKVAVAAASEPNTRATKALAESAAGSDDKYFQRLVVALGTERARHLVQTIEDRLRTIFE